MEEGSALQKPRARKYQLAVVDPDSRVRTKVVMQLALRADPVALETLAELNEGIDLSKPAVVVFGPGMANDTGWEQISRLRRDHPELGMVFAVEEVTLELLQKAMHSGVNDVVSVTGGEHSIAQIVDRVGDLVAALSSRVSQAAMPGKKGRLIVSFSTKGGVGKSTVASNLGVALAQQRPDEVVLVDADLQFGDVGVLLSIPPKHTVIDAAAAVHEGDPEFIRSVLTRHNDSGLLVLTAPLEPSSADQVRPEDMIAIVQQLQQLYEFVVVDMPPHFDDLVLALIEIADDVLLVASMDIPSIKNVKVGMQTLDLLSIAGNKIHLVLNRANAKVKLDVREVEQALGIPAEFPIPSDISVPQAVNRGVPVVLDNPRSPAARAVQTIAEKILADTNSEHPGGRV